MEIVLIDRHPIIRKGLEQVLNSNFNEANLFEAESIVDFHESFPNQFPDLVIIGVSNFRKENDLNFINLARKWYPKGSVIAYDDEIDLHMITQYLTSGVSGYLPKSAGVKELVDCVNQVLDGKRYLSAEVLLWVLNTYSFESKPSRISVKDRAELTRREFEIAGYLAEGMKTSWIAKRLDRKPSTISTIKINIFKKLKVDNIVSLRNVVQALR